MTSQQRFAGEERRLHPATLALAVLRLGPQALQMIPAMLAIGVAGGWQWVAPALLAALLLSLLFSWLRWVRFTWRVDDDDLAISSGILARNQRTIPFDRIQDVNIEQGVLHRLLGLAKVGIETGGGGQKDEGSLDAISALEAQALRDHIRSHRSLVAPAVAAAAGDAAAVSVTGTEADERELFAMTGRRLAVAGVFNFSLAILAVLFGAVQWFDDLLPFDPFSPAFWVDLLANTWLADWLVAHQWLAAVGSAALLLLLGMVTGVVRMVLTNWQFRLTRTQRGLRRTRGLTTRTDVVVPLARIQGAVLHSGPVSRRLGYYRLSVQSLAQDSKEEADHLLAPFARLEEVDAILAEIGLDRADAEQAPRNDPRWQGIRPVEMAVGLGIALALAGAALLPYRDWAGRLDMPSEMLVAGSWLWLVLLALALLTAISSLLDWRARRWRFDGRTLHLLGGAFSRHHLILPARNVQSADLTAGPLLRLDNARGLRLGVAGAAAGQHVLHALPATLAHVLRAQVLAAR